MRKQPNFIKHLRNLAGEKGRPPDLAEQFVLENLTFGARRLMPRVIEYLAADLGEAAGTAKRSEHPETR